MVNYSDRWQNPSVIPIPIFLLIHCCHRLSLCKTPEIHNCEDFHPIDCHIPLNMAVSSSLEGIH